MNVLTKDVHTEQGQENIPPEDGNLACFGKVGKKVRHALHCKALK